MLCYDSNPNIPTVLALTQVLVLCPASLLMLSLTWASLKIGFQHPAISQCWNHDVEKNVPFWPLSSSAIHQRVPHSVLCIEVRPGVSEPQRNGPGFTCSTRSWLEVVVVQEGVVLCGSGGVLRVYFLLAGPNNW